MKFVWKGQHSCSNLLISNLVVSARVLQLQAENPTLVMVARTDIGFARKGNIHCLKNILGKSFLLISFFLEISFPASSLFSSLAPSRENTLQVTSLPSIFHCYHLSLRHSAVASVTPATECPLTALMRKKIFLSSNNTCLRIIALVQ